MSYPQALTGAPIAELAPTRVLLLDDEASISRAAALALRSYGIDLDSCEEVDHFIHLASTRRHRALIIDWNLRTCEGTDICARLRRDGEERPIAILSGKLDADHGREMAQATGADCYIAKPSAAEDLAHEIWLLLDSRSSAKQHTAQVRAALPHGHRFQCLVRKDGSTLTIGLCEDRVVISDYIVRLRPKELELLEVLLRRSGQVVSKDELARLVWGVRSAPTTSIVETSMSRLRTALGNAGGIIETVRGGYRISVAHGD